MKINRLETHDRLLELNKQADQISKGCQDCINQRPQEFGDIPFYIFAHKRELGMDEKMALFASGQYMLISEVPTHRMIWQPRLKKPQAQVNSMLFKYYPQNDTIEVIWMLPEPETWDQYTKGKLCENKTVSESIHLFKTNKQKLESDSPDDLSDKQAEAIYKEMSRNANSKII